MKFEFKKEYLALLVLILILFILFQPIQNSNPKTEKNECVKDSDCVVFGETGTCNCGCYNSTQIKELEKNKNKGCFCLPPKNCQCVNNKCVRKN
ncbi:MAG: hypothetical protein ACOCUU_00585 [Nanoarchaeota archaeon]